MDVEKLKQDAREGRIDTDQLVAVIITLQKLNQQQMAELEAARKRIEELERRVGGGPTQKLDQPFSVKAEEKRQAARGKKQKKKPHSPRRGRVSTQEKLALAEREENVYPEGLNSKQCTYSHSRAIRRIENGRCVLVAYHIYRKQNRFGKIPAHGEGRVGPHGVRD